MLGQLADLAAVGIENARLYGELEARVLKRTQELEHSNRELEAFSYSVSHDLRGPLRAIAGFTGLLRERHYDSIDADSRRYLDRIEAGTQRMSGLIDDLLELGRVTRVEIRRESVNLSSLAEAVLNRIRERTPERVAQFTIEPDHNVEGDLRLLEIVLENLLDNAWKFTASRERADIRFGGRAVGAERVFFVRDNGVGFDPRYASNLFGTIRDCRRAALCRSHDPGLTGCSQCLDAHELTGLRELLIEAMHEGHVSLEIFRRPLGNLVVPGPTRRVHHQDVSHGLVSFRVCRRCGRWPGKSELAGSL